MVYNGAAKKRIGGTIMQHEITEVIPLLDGKGNLTQPGWARKLLPVYER